MSPVYNSHAKLGVTDNMLLVRISGIYYVWGIETQENSDAFKYEQNRQYIICTSVTYLDERKYH